MTLKRAIAILIGAGLVDLGIWVVTKVSQGGAGGALLIGSGLGLILSVLLIKEWMNPDYEYEEEIMKRVEDEEDEDEDEEDED